MLGVSIPSRRKGEQAVDFHRHLTHRFHCTDPRNTEECPSLSTANADQGGSAKIEMAGQFGTEFNSC